MQSKIQGIQQPTQGNNEQVKTLKFILGETDNRKESILS